MPEADYMEQIDENTRLTTLLYLASLVLLVLTLTPLGTEINGSQRWLVVPGFRLQPSEMAKLTVILALAAYYDWLDTSKTSRPVWVLVPVAFNLRS